MTLRVSVILLSLGMSLSLFAAGPVQWPAAQGGNGHWYQLVTTPFLFWPDARAQAAAMGGYLATVTSASENAWIKQNILPSAPAGTAVWIGGASFALNGVWSWVEGLEAGQVFWNNGVTITFANWGTASDPGEVNEPNNCCNGPEFWLAMNITSGKWLDLFAAQEPFLVEFDHDPTTFFVSSTVSNQVLHYDVAGNFLGQSTIGGNLIRPYGIGFGPDGKLYVSGEFNNAVLRYDSITASFISSFASTGLSGPRGLTFGGDGNLYVASLGNQQVIKFNGSTGAFIQALVSPVAFHPQSLTFGSDGNLYVADTGNGNILRFNGTTGLFMNVFASGGSSVATDLAFGPDGNLYVATGFPDSRVVRYNGKTGAFIGTFVSSGSGGLLGADGLVFGDDEKLYVSSSQNSEILAYSATTGVFSSIVIPSGGGGLTTPTLILRHGSSSLPPPSMADSDGDGIPDDWETHGYWHNGKFVDLPAMGANPNHKDVFVWIDYMTGHQPSQTDVLNAIQSSFARVSNSMFSIPNPDGQDGISLHLKLGKEVSHVTQLGTLTCGTYDWSAFDAVKLVNFPDELTPTYHYSLFAHNGPLDDNCEANSGISRAVPSHDFLITLGSFPSTFFVFGEGGTTSNQKGTFMHELGHNLGLCHGGPKVLAGADGQCNENYKPNYLSIMNYSFQLDGLRNNGANGLFDYSRFALPSLDKAHLNENLGLNGDASVGAYGTRWYCPSHQVGQPDASTDSVNAPINWNCDKRLLFFDIFETNVAANINADSTSILTSYSDWHNLDFGGGLSAAGGSLPRTTQVTELSVTSAQALLPFPPSGLNASVEACVMHLTWTLQGAPSEYTYKLYRGLDVTSVTPLLSSNTNFALDTSTDPVKSYFYSVTTTNTFGTEGNLATPISVKGGIDLIDDLAALVKAQNLAPGIQNSLVSKLQNAVDAANDGRVRPACNQVEAFVAEVQAQLGKGLNNSQATQFLNAAVMVGNRMCCK